MPIEVVHSSFYILGLISFILAVFEYALDRVDRSNNCILASILFTLLSIIKI